MAVWASSSVKALRRWEDDSTNSCLICFGSGFNGYLPPPPPLGTRLARSSARPPSNTTSSPCSHRRG
eukprot:8292292-Pyramimonas_sp.AAC.1